jgi:hypothetical protein
MRQLPHFFIYLPLLTKIQKYGSLLIDKNVLKQILLKMDINNLLFLRNYAAIEDILKKGGNNINEVSECLTTFKQCKWVFEDAGEKFFHTQKLAIYTSKKYAKSLPEYLWRLENVPLWKMDVQEKFMKDLDFRKCIEILQNPKTNRKVYKVILHNTVNIAKTIEELEELLPLVISLDDYDRIVRLKISALLFKVS